MITYRSEHIETYTSRFSDSTASCFEEIAELHKVHDNCCSL